METIQGAVSMKRPVHLPKAAEIVAEEIRRQIVRRELKEGDALPCEARLMEQFEISRPTLREALRVLEAEHLISVHRGARRGAKIQTPGVRVAARNAGLALQVNGGSLEDVLTTQTVLEAGAVRVLARARDSKALTLLRQTLAEEEQALDDLERFSACAVRFHESLIEATRNPSMAFMAGMLQDIVERHVRIVAARQPAMPGRRPAWRTKSHEVHTDVVELIATGKADEAEDLWWRHATASHRAMARQLPIEDVLDLFE